ncbi:MAG: PIN domain-containing protein [Bacillota bacterium]
MRAIDANIVLRYLLADNQTQYERCKLLFEKVSTGKETLYLPDAALNDVVYVMTKVYRVSNSETASLMSILLMEKNIAVDNRKLAIDALRLFAEFNVDWSDCVIASAASYKGIAEIFTFDKDFDKFKFIKRLEP